MTNPTDKLAALEAAATQPHWKRKYMITIQGTGVSMHWVKEELVSVGSGNDNDAALIATLRNIAPELIAFLPNADHADDCESLPSADDWKNDFQDRPCTCGLDALLAKIEQETGE